MPTTETPNSYGQASHYVGEEGKRYFAWQRRTGELGGQINARSFKEFVKSTDCVLDFGCGGGFLIKSLNCRSRLGVELNPVAREVAEQNGVQCFTDVSEVPDNSVDVVVSNHALEHVPYPIRALSDLRRVMKPGAVIVVKLPIDDWKKKIDPADVNHHLYTWTPQLFANCLKEAGFENISAKVYTHAWFPGCMKSHKILPEFLFDLFCNAYSVYSRQRQLIAVARKAS